MYVRKFWSREDLCLRINNRRRDKPDYILVVESLKWQIKQRKPIDK